MHARVTATATSTLRHRNTVHALDVARPEVAHQSYVLGPVVRAWIIYNRAGECQSIKKSFSPAGGEPAVGERVPRTPGWSGHGPPLRGHGCTLSHPPVTLPKPQTLIHERPINPTQTPASPSGFSGVSLKVSEPWSRPRSPKLGQSPRP